MEYEFRNNGNIIFENAELVFLNFSGKITAQNKSGERNFAIVIRDGELANKLKDDGWNVKQFKQRDPNEIPDHYLPVAIRYGTYYPPHVYVRQNMRSEPMEWDEDAISQLDFVEKETIDLEIRPRHWDVKGETGIKAYVKNMYVTLREDRLAEKYANVHQNDEENLPFNFN